MSSIGAIKIAFNDANRQASRLADCASELRTAENRLNEILGNLQREWQGDASDQFRQKCDILKGKIEKTAGDLDRISSAIRQSAQAYYSAEMKAIQLAQTRSSGGGGGGSAGGGGSMGGR